MAARKRDSAPGGRGAESAKETTDPYIIAHVLELVKARVMVGETVAATDYPPEHRAEFWAAIPLLRDELPNLRPRWRTIGEQHVDGRRLRELTYRLRQSGYADPLIGWHSLGKDARENRKPKRAWRRKIGGAIRADLAALLILGAVAGLLLAGVLQ